LPAAGEIFENSTPILPAAGEIFENLALETRKFHKN
jgi:hypothetical protein